MWQSVMAEGIAVENPFPHGSDGEKVFTLLVKTAKFLKRFL
jgi:hypothetical protein